MSTLPLNVKQKRVALGAVAVLILMFLCPPWYERSQSQMYHEDSSLGLRGSSDKTHGMGLPLFHESFNGYHWLFYAPRGRFDYDQETSDYTYHTYKGTSSGYHIAWGILFLQWLLISLVALALVHRYRDKIQVMPEPRTLTIADQPKQGEELCSQRSPEIITSEPEAELPVGKDIIPAKQDIDNKGVKGVDNSSTAILAIFGSIAGLVILIAIGIALNPRPSPTAPQSPAVPHSEETRGLSSYDQFNQKWGLPVSSEGKEAAAKVKELDKSGIAFMEAGNYQQAIAEFNKIIELEPLDHAAYNSRGEAHLKLGNYQQAREDFNRAIIASQKTNDSKVPGGLPDLAVFVTTSSIAKYYRNRGLAYEKLGNKNQAIEDLKTAAKDGDKEAQKYLLSKEMTW